MGAKPPLPEDDTDERQNYIVNPNIQPVAPPKGDVQTGQPVGPAYTAMPRDAQRAMVDSTFRQISRGPSKQMVSNTLSTGMGELAKLDQMRRNPNRAPIGGVQMPEPGEVVQSVVANPEHSAFQQLLRQFPAEAEHLIKMPGITRYADVAPAEMAKIGGRAATIPVTEQVAQQVASHGVIRGVDATVEQIAELARTPGSTLQLFPKGMSVSPQTPLHEAGHALRFSRTENATGIPQITAAKAQEILAAAKKAGIATGRYGGDVIHQALDALSKLRAGGFSITR